MVHLLLTDYEGTIFISVKQKGELIGKYHENYQQIFQFYNFKKLTRTVFSNYSCKITQLFWNYIIFIIYSYNISVTWIIIKVKAIFKLSLYGWLSQFLQKKYVTNKLNFLHIFTIRNPNYFQAFLLLNNFAQMTFLFFEEKFWACFWSCFKIFSLDTFKIRVVMSTFIHRISIEIVLVFSTFFMMKIYQKWQLPSTWINLNNSW